MLVKVRANDLAVLTDEDKKAIQSIYRHRCLDENQLAKYLYAELDDGENGYTLERLRVLMEAGFIDFYEYDEGRKHVFYPSVLGVQLVRDLSGVPLYRVRKNGKRRNYEATAKELRMSDHLLDHQTRLNTLSLELERRCGLAPDSYKDSKFASNFTYAQPDGVFELPEFDVFLEMDMGHERGPALRSKWEHYRTYFNSRDYYLRRNKPIIVLFALEQVRRVSLRGSTVIRSLSQTVFEMVGSGFDCYLGTNEELYEIGERVIKSLQPPAYQQAEGQLRNRFGFRISRPKAIQEICGIPFLYMWMPDERGKVAVLDGRPQEFLLEDGTDRRVGSLKQAAYYSQTQAGIMRQFGRNIPLLMIVSDEARIKRDLIAADAMAVPDVYFTTVKRLAKDPFCSALFQFDALGRRFHFENASLTRYVHEHL